MRILFVINSKNSKQHKEYFELMKKALGDNEYGLVDVSDNRPLNEIYKSISTWKSDLIFTFDCAGFELRTELNEVSYNRIKCRIAHMIFEKPYKMEQQLSCELNLSHFVYLPQSENIEAFIDTHKNIPNIKTMPSMSVEGIENWFAIERLEMEV